MSSGRGFAFQRMTAAASRTIPVAPTKRFPRGDPGALGRAW